MEGDQELEKTAQEQWLERTTSIRIDNEVHHQLKADAARHHRTLVGQIAAYQEAYHGLREVGT